MITDRHRNDGKATSDTRGNFGKGAIALAILAGVMGFTNPPREDYLSYASEKLATELKTSICNESQMREFLGSFGGALVGTCKTLVTSQRSTMERFIDNATKRQNLMIFSVYSTEIGNRTYRTLGAFGNFLTVSEK